MSSALSRLLDTKHTIVVVGPGGVGKTTTAAALALQGARQGKKVLVLTVDPARRLATSMGVDEIGHEEVRVSPARFAEAGVDLGSGALYAMMLDTKRTFDALVERQAPTAEARDRILNNRFYQTTSSALAGSQEYMAMEKLYEVREERDYDLIVLDTPPSTNAADFFSAPQRLGRFLDSGSLKILLTGARRAGKFGLGVFNTLLVRVMNRFIGADTFFALLDFIEAFSELYAGFTHRAARVSELLRSDGVAFAIVSSTDQMALEESLGTYDTLATEGMPFGAFLVNRVRAPFLPAGATDHLTGPSLVTEHLRDAARKPALAHHTPADLAATVETISAACDQYAQLAAADADRIAALRLRLGPDAERVWTVPLFDRDIHDLAGLAAFAEHVFRE